MVKGFVHGDLLCNWTDPIILNEKDGNECKIIPETIGQFTGLKDLVDNEIYEGDKVIDNSGRIMVVGWSEKFSSFVLKSEEWVFQHWFGEAANPTNAEVIGDIHDN